MPRSKQDGDSHNIVERRAFGRSLSFLPDAIKLNRYRPDFYGTRWGRAPWGDARILCMVGWWPRADGRLRVEDERMRVLHEDARWSRGGGVSGSSEGLRGAFRSRDRGH